MGTKGGGTLGEQRTTEGLIAKKEYIKQYNRENYENITITVKKGEKAHYKELAAKYGLPLSHFFLTAVDEYTNKHPI